MGVGDGPGGTAGILTLQDEIGENFEIIDNSENDKMLYNCNSCFIMLLCNAPGWVSLRAQGASGPVDPNTPGFGYAFIEFANIEVECVECGRKSSEICHENWANLIRVARRQRRP